MSRYSDMKTLYEKRIEQLETDIECYRIANQAHYHEIIEPVLKEVNAKCKFYEQIIHQLLNTDTPRTDNTIIFEGKIYRPISYVLNHDATNESVDTLSIDCQLYFDPSTVSDK